MAKVLKYIIVEFLLYLGNNWVNKVPFHSIRNFYYKMAIGLELAPFSSIHLQTRFDTRGQFSLGTHSTINRNCRIDNRGQVKIGQNVSISEDVTILTASHDLNDPQFKAIKKSVTIEDYAFIGTGAIILPGVTIGRGAGVGAGSVVTKSISPNTIVAGNPARKIADRTVEYDYYATYRRYLH